MSPPRARTVLSQQPIDGKTVDTQKHYHRKPTLEMPIIPQTHHPTPAAGTGRSKHRKRSPKPLAHSAKATPSPELPCACRTVPAKPVIDNPPKSPSPTPPLNHQRPFLTTAHPGRQRDRTGASIGSDHQNPSRTARKQRSPPSFPARAGPFPRSPSPKTYPQDFSRFLRVQSSPSSSSSLP